MATGSISLYVEYNVFEYRCQLKCLGGIGYFLLWIYVTANNILKLSTTAVPCVVFV